MSGREERVSKYACETRYKATLQALYWFFLSAFTWCRTWSIKHQMVPKESLRWGLVEVSMESGETKYLLLSLGEEEPHPHGSAADLPWRLSWPKGTAQERLVAQGGHPSVPLSPLRGQGSRQLAAEPTPNSSVTKGEKHFLSGGITLSCAFDFSPTGQECCLVECGDGAQGGYQRRWLFPGVGWGERFLMFGSSGVKSGRNWTCLCCGEVSAAA